MTEPYYQDATVTVLHGDCLDVLRELPDCSVDAVVTDPPYGLEFMGKEWDKFGRNTGNGYREKPRMTDDHMGKGFKQLPNHFEAGRPFQWWCELWAAECLRVLKPGGHMLAFGGTRTWHRLACAIEDAGFEMRDSIAWLYGSGFPKSLDVSKAIDKAAGAERGVVGQKDRYRDGGKRANLGNVNNWGGTFGTNGVDDVTAPATEAAQQWAGWGTALKPAFEPICVARKPLIGTVAANVQAYGTGALNIDGCRIGHDEPEGRPSTGMHGKAAGIMGRTVERHRETTAASTAGRWPANVILDESQADALDQMSGELAAPGHSATDLGGGIWGSGGERKLGQTYNDPGGASRFFYTAKAGSDERITHNGIAHSTVKPLSLMRYLVRLVTPPGGTILEPFAGSGTTVEAAILEGFKVIAIEREADYLPLITQRIHRRRDPVAYLTEGGHDLGLFGDDELEPLRVVPVAVDGNGRDGEASAERRYTDRGSTNFAPKPGRRRPA